MTSLKSKFMDLYEIVHDACIENSDGKAKARTTLLLTGYMSNIVSSITAGIFFTAFMLALGASDVYIGYISIATSTCTLIQFLSPLLWERIKRRKPALVAWAFISNILTYLGITLIPFLKTQNETKLIIYVVITIFTSLVGSLFSSATSAWTLPSLPFEKRVNYSSLANLGATIINVAAAFLASIYLDSMESSETLVDGISNTLIAVVVLRLISFAIIMTSSVLTALHVKEYPYETAADQKDNKGLRMLLSPLRDKAFMMIILIPAFQTLSGSIIGNFYNIHLVSNVNLSYTAISAVTFITTPATLLFTIIWTMLLRKNTWLKCLAVAYAGYAVAWTSNVFISATTPYFYFISIIIGNLFSPCMNLVGGNLLYMKLPEANRTAYLGFYTILTQVCAIIGQWIGTTFVQFTPNLKFTLFGVEICNLQLTSGIAAFGMVCLVVYTLRMSRNPEYSGRP